MRAFVEHLEEGMMALLLAIMTCLTFVQVILRYLFGTGIVWSLEATTYSFAWLVLIGMSYCVRTQSHIAVDIVSKHLPKNIRHYVALFAVAICLVYCGLMIYGSSIFVSRLYSLGHYARDVHAPKWLLTGIMPVAFALLAFRFLEVGRHVIKGRDEDMEFGKHDTASTLMGKTGKTDK